MTGVVSTIKAVSLVDIPAKQLRYQYSEFFTHFRRYSPPEPASTFLPSSTGPYAGVMGCSSSRETSQPTRNAAPKPRHVFRPIPDRYETIGASSSSQLSSYLEALPDASRIESLCVISAIGRTLEAFDDDNIIPAFGFGDSVTKGDGAFSFAEGRKGCQGFDEVLKRYNALTPTLQLWGPTSFAPVIREAIRAVREDPGYHILVIIADGQVNEPVATRQAIVEASHFPISIIMVGVGDGPWDMMEEFDDKLPARRFDNFQFVDYNTVLKRNLRNPEAGFAMQALMEIPGIGDVYTLYTRELALAF
ncbi:hypothetical protein BBJ28_00013090 [Nothophytophthora sp. Chile5]|nr:hypothetical protein BBJ28_00013090 [Nothophytophthora sp. Chile5]